MCPKRKDSRRVCDITVACVNLQLGDINAVILLLKVGTDTNSGSTKRPRQS